MRRLDGVVVREEHRGRGRPRLFEEPVHVNLVVERAEWERFQEACRTEQAAASSKMRELMSRFGADPQTS